MFGGDKFRNRGRNNLANEVGDLFIAVVSCLAGRPSR